MKAIFVGGSWDGKVFKNQKFLPHQIRVPKDPNEPFVFSEEARKPFSEHELLYKMRDDDTHDQTKFAHYDFEEELSL